MNYWDDYKPGYETFFEPAFEQDRQAAIDWAKNILQNPAIILDTETTGLDNKAEAIQIAIIDKSGSTLFDSLVKPEETISSIATSIHGIDKLMVKDAPSFPEVYPVIKDLVESFTTIIYNASFDRRIIEQQCKRHHLKPIEFDSVCAMHFYSMYCGDWNDYYQSYTWQKLPGGDHSALGDCKATLAVIKEMASNE